MKLYNVYLLAPIATWHSMKTTSKERAIELAMKQDAISCDYDTPTHWVAEEVEEN